MAGALDSRIAIAHPLHFMALVRQALLEKNPQGAIVLHD
jgi:hypothetical protein